MDGTYKPYNKLRLLDKGVFNELLEVIKALYLEGNSAQEIKDRTGVEVTVRQIQRWIKSMGITRNTGDAFRNAIKRKRVVFVTKDRRTYRTKLSPTLRYQILLRDDFKCIKCGATAQDDRLEVDHKDNNPANQQPDNLETLCHRCNVGKPSPNRANTTTRSGS